MGFIIDLFIFFVKTFTDVFIVIVLSPICIGYSQNTRMFLL